MHIIIPMSGVGQRFINAGYKDCKPLIQIDGKPMIEHVIKSFPGETQFTFVCNTEHLATTNIKKELERIVPGCTIISVEKKKVGPVYHVMQAANVIDDDKPCLVSYCDQDMIFDRAGFKEKMDTEGYDGAMQAYIGFHPHLFLHPDARYAGMRVDDKNDLLEIKEKHSFTPSIMDCYQGTGSFYFKTGAMLKKYCQKTMDEGEAINGELYLSQVFDVMQRDGLHIYVDHVEKFAQRGTPQDLEEYTYRLTKVANNDVPENADELRIYNYWKEYKDMKNAR